MRIFTNKEGFIATAMKGLYALTILSLAIWSTGGHYLYTQTVHAGANVRIAAVSISPESAEPGESIDFIFTFENLEVNDKQDIMKSLQIFIPEGADFEDDSLSWSFSNDSEDTIEDLSLIHI